MKINWLDNITVEHAWTLDHFKVLGSIFYSFFLHKSQSNISNWRYSDICANKGAGISFNYYYFFLHIRFFTLWQAAVSVLSKSRADVFISTEIKNECAWFEACITTVCCFCEITSWGPKKNPLGLCFIQRLVFQSWVFNELAGERERGDLAWGLTHCANKRMTWPRQTNPSCVQSGRWWWMSEAETKAGDWCWLDGLLLWKNIKQNTGQNKVCKRETYGAPEGKKWNAKKRCTFDRSRKGFSKPSACFRVRKPETNPKNNSGTHRVQIWHWPQIWRH